MNLGSHGNYSSSRGGRRGGGGKGGGTTNGRAKPRTKGIKKEKPDSYSTLGKLVSKATKPTKETGYKHLDEDTVRRIKAIAKQDAQCAAGALSYLMQRMTAKSAEARYMALSVIDVLFQRSKVVRAALVADLKNFMSLAIGHNARQPLPGPAAAADALRKRALAVMEEWNDAHGHVYKGLRAAYRFLRESKRMQFPELQARVAREQQEAARREKHAERLLRAKYFQAKREIEEQTPELEAMVREMHECFAILVPAVPGVDAVSTTTTTTTTTTITTSAEPEEGSRQSRKGNTSEAFYASSASAASASAVASTKLSRASSLSSSWSSSAEGDSETTGDVIKSIHHGASASASSPRRRRRRMRRVHADGVAPAATAAGGDYPVGGGSGRWLPPPPRRIALASSGVDVSDTRTEKEKPHTAMLGEDEGVHEDSKDDAGGDDDDAEGVQWEEGGGAGGGGGGGGDGGDGGDGDGREEQDDDSDGDYGIQWEDAGGTSDKDDDDDADDVAKAKSKKGKGKVVVGKSGRQHADSDDPRYASESDSDDTEEEEDGFSDGGAGGSNQRRDVGGRGAREERLRDVADTVDAAGLGTSGYELQIEVPMGWSIGGSTDGVGGEEDTALVVSALRERYKILTSRMLPLMSDWIQTLSRVTFEPPALATTTTNSNSNSSSARTTREATSAATSMEQQTCSHLLSRCLAGRNSANIAVSKFLELKIDVEGAGGEGRAGAAAVASGAKRRKDYAGRSEGAALEMGASISKVPRLHIRLEEARSRGGTGGR